MIESKYNMVIKYRFISLILVSLILLLVGLTGCEQENISGTKSESHGKEKKEIPPTEGYFVSQDLAIYAAEEFANQYNFKLNRLTKGEKTKSKRNKKTVEHVLTLSDKEKKAALYLINYEDGGFAIVSADKRIPAILAHSNKKKMPFNKDVSIPGGLSWWLEQSISGVHKVRIAKNKGANNYGAGWNNLLGIKKKLRDLPPDECEEWYYSNGPLLETTWGQGVGYNNEAPYLNCNIPSNGRAWTGCVATAMAQIMAYHEFPNNYNWSAMPNNGGNNAVSELMFDASEAVNMDFGCGGSGASEDDIEPAFKNTFGYSSSANKIEYIGNTDAVIHNIENNLPVILTGYNKEYFIGLFPKRGSGHAWVAEGYRHNFSCNTGASYLSFYMNWGWDSSYNGWFWYNDLTPGDNDFNYKSAAIVGIHP